MKHNAVCYAMIVASIGLIGLAPGRTHAQLGGEIHIESFSWGMSTGQVARVSVTGLSDGSVRFVNPPVGTSSPLDIRLELRDTIGNVIAQSDVITVEPGTSQFWDVSRDQLPAAEPTGRIQVRARVRVVSRSIVVRPNRLPLGLTVELIDARTGKTESYVPFNPYITVDYTGRLN
jgi:hypothetical protein